MPKNAVHSVTQALKVEGGSIPSVPMSGRLVDRQTARG